MATHKALQLWKAASGEEDRLDDAIIRAGYYYYPFRTTTVELWEI